MRAAGVRAAAASAEDREEQDPTGEEQGSSPVGTLLTPLERLGCLVLNAGGTYHPDKDAAEGWAHEAAAVDDRPDLAFIQEVPSNGWLDRWCEQGYRPIFGHPRGWTVRSAILTLLDERTCVPLTADDIPELRYHGEYVAAARLTGRSHGQDVTLFSVHASPAPTSDEYLAHHPDSARIRPRSGGADRRYAGKRLDSDVVLDTVSRYGPNVLACGDLNEARGWDDVPGHEGHTWGEEYFGRRDTTGQMIDGAVQSARLIDVPLAEDAHEVVTRRAPGHPPLQLDHLLAGPEVAARITSVSVHAAWASEAPIPAGLADHAPIRFALNV